MKLTGVPFRFFSIFFPRSASPDNGSDGAASHGRNSREETITQGMFYLGSGGSTHQFDKEFSSSTTSICHNPMSAVATSGGSVGNVGMVNTSYPPNMLSAFATVEQVSLRNIHK